MAKLEQPNNYFHALQHPVENISKPAGRSTRKIFGWLRLRLKVLPEHVPFVAVDRGAGKL